MSYSIFTLCTKNYRDAYDFVIDSWLRTAAERIYVYTDDVTWGATHPRIIMVHKFAPDEVSWEVNCGRKAIVTDNILRRRYGPEEKNLLFLDIDCFVVYDGFQEVFDKEFDIAATRLGRDVASSGVFFLKASKKAIRFATEWCKLQERMVKNRGVRDGNYDQVPFTQALRGVYGKWPYLQNQRVIDLPVCVYNRKVKDIRRSPEKLEALRRDNPMVLHFYNNSYRSRDNVDEVFKALGIS